jgi:hypothetical protein
MDINLDQEGTTRTHVPEITIKEPKKAGKIKWKMIPRETEDRGQRRPAYRRTLYAMEPSGRGVSRPRRSNLCRAKHGKHW